MRFDWLVSRKSATMREKKIENKNLINNLLVILFFRVKTGHKAQIDDLTKYILRFSQFEPFRAHVNSRKFHFA